MWCGHLACTLLRCNGSACFQQARFGFQPKCRLRGQDTRNCTQDGCAPEDDFAGRRRILPAHDRHEGSTIDWATPVQPGRPPPTVAAAHYRSFKSCLT